MNKRELIEYVLSQYGVKPEYLWKKYPNDFVLRHQMSGKKNGKWFAVVMDVPKKRLGLPGDELINIINVKCGPILLGSYLGIIGFLPAYHMNKDNWITICLDGSVSRKDIIELIDISYGLTK